MNADDSPLDALRVVAATLQRLGVAHMVCGSLASSMHGEPRASSGSTISWTAS